MGENGEPSPWSREWTSEVNTHPEKPADPSPARNKKVIWVIVALIVMASVIIAAFIGYRIFLETDQRGEGTPSLYIGSGTQFRVEYPDSVSVPEQHPCTIAAVGEGPDGRFALTSGQCVSNNGMQISVRGDLIGTVEVTNITVGVPTSDDHTYDYGLISLNNSVTLEPSDISGIGFPEMGETVCMNGSVTGRSCGKVGISSGGIIHVSGLNPVTGDQGSPLLSENGSTLYGMLSDLPDGKRSETTFASAEVSMDRLKEESGLVRNGEIK